MTGPGQIVLDFWRANSGDMQIGHLRNRYLWGPAVDQILAEEDAATGIEGNLLWTFTAQLTTVLDLASYHPATDVTTVENHLVYDA